MSEQPPYPRFRIRIVFPGDRMVGPGKMELLERIARTGSIAAAGREMRMSYKRAWQLVEALNATFQEPLVHATRGGARQGGTTLTPAGETVLREYRALESQARAACEDRLRRLEAMLRAPPDENSG